MPERTLRTTRADYEKWLDQQAAEAQQDPSGGRVWDGGSLAPFDHLFERCPVAQPRGYGDGFGAPRYAGGYHLHKGVDIVAPMGAEIYAPFAGQAYTSFNALGGNVVFVVGAHGTVYNAHLSSYSSSSNSSVVGRRGDRVRRQHGVELHALTTTSSSTPARCRVTWPVKLLRVLGDRGRDQPVPDARAGLRLAPPLPVPRLDPGSMRPEDVQHVGVVGSGLMGSGIVEVCARAGLRVTFVEASDALVAAGRARVERSVAKAVERGKLDPAAAGEPPRTDRRGH